MSKYLATYGKPRLLGILETGDDGPQISAGSVLVVTSHRGEEISLVVGPLSEAQEKEYRSMRTISEHGEGPIRGGDPVVTDLTFLRFPNDDDCAVYEEHNQSGDGVLRIARELVEWHKLPIKLVDAEFLLDEKKLFFYFTSDQRVDFRMLVKDLARRFKTRIELRQMGVRDEARIIRGLSSCGLPCCCSYWLNQFAPIGIRMVKEQNIALNPAKISGICGRLMCCMAYEHKVYKELWEGLPGPGSKIKTPAGNYVVVSIDVGKKALRCHRPGGGDMLVPLALFEEFKTAVTAGEQWEPPQPEAQEKEDFLGRRCDKCRTARTREPLKAPEKPAQEAAATHDATEEKKAPGQKRPRRRGRRGGRAKTAEGHAAQAAPVAAEKKHEKHVNKPQQAKNQQQAASSPKPEGGEAGTAPKRSRRRRRPRRAGAPREKSE